MMSLLLSLFLLFLLLSFPVFFSPTSFSFVAALVCIMYQMTCKFINYQRNISLTFGVKKEVERRGNKSDFYNHTKWDREKKREREREKRATHSFFLFLLRQERERYRVSGGEKSLTLLFSVPLFFFLLIPHGRDAGIEVRREMTTKQLEGRMTEQKSGKRLWE